MFTLLLISHLMLDGEPAAELEKARQLIRETGPKEKLDLLRALGTIRDHGDKSDVKLLVTLRNDLRVTLTQGGGGYPQTLARFSDAAACVAVKLLGQNVERFGAIEAGPLPVRAASISPGSGCSKAKRLGTLVRLRCGRGWTQMWRKRRSSRRARRLAG